MISHVGLKKITRAVDFEWIYKFYLIMSRLKI